MINVMYIFLLPLCAAAKVTVQGKCSKSLDGSVKSIFLFNAMVFTALVAVMGALFWRSAPNIQLILASFLFAVCNVAFQVCYTFAFRAGSVSLATIINNFNIVFPLMFGVFFYHEKLSSANLIAFVFLVIALILIPSGKGGGTSIRWLIFSMTAFLANGLSNCLMLWYARTFPAQLRNVFIICGYAWAALICCLIAFFIRGQSYSFVLNKFMIIGILGIGVILGIYNLLLIFVLSVIPASVFYPINNILTMIAIAVSDYFLYRKKLSVKQFIGFISGMICVILLNI